MTSIKELERQHEQAKSRLVNAQDAVKAAREKLVAARIEEATAKLAARGIAPGTIVTDGKNTWGFMGFIDNRWSPMARPDLVLHSLKRDGTISKRRVSAPYGLMSAHLRPVTDAE